LVAFRPSDSFGVQRSAFSIQRSAFGVQHSAFGVQHSAAVDPDHAIISSDGERSRLFFGVAKANLSPFTLSVLANRLDPEPRTKDELEDD
jgi:hypothetical protein